MSVSHEILRCEHAWQLHFHVRREPESVMGHIDYLINFTANAKPFPYQIHIKRKTRPLMDNVRFFQVDMAWQSITGNTMLIITSEVETIVAGYRTHRDSD